MMTGRQLKWSMAMWQVLMLFGAFQLGMQVMHHEWWMDKGIPDVYYRNGIVSPLIFMFGGALQFAWNWHRTTIEPPSKSINLPSRWLLIVGTLAVGGGLAWWGSGVAWTYAQAPVYSGLGLVVAGIIMERLGK